MGKIYKLVFILLFLLSCTNDKPKTKAEEVRYQLKSGTWRGILDIGEKSIPFNFILLEKNGTYEISILNADENIAVNEITVKEDSMHIEMPVFDSEFELRIVDEATIEGVWINNYFSSDYRIPFVANFGQNYRFTDEKKEPKNDISGKYQVTFSPGSEKEKKAIGLFKQGEKDPNHLTGTFITETGDYRHLEGTFKNDSLYLSGFDGAHAYLFTASVEDGKLNGDFYSGTHHSTKWNAISDKDFELKDPYELTFLKEGYDKVEFTFPNLEGKPVSLDDEKYQDKVVIVQIMGSWCPNCMDETVYLTELHNKYQDKGLEIIALAFERTNDREKAIELLKRLKITFNSKYDFLLATYKRNVGPDSLLPMLDHFISFPTAIFIDRKGNVRKIHTGFYGPGTGNYYLRYMEETDSFVQKLLQEKS